jgi:hypothetical protein
MWDPHKYFLARISSPLTLFIGNLPTASNFNDLLSHDVSDPLTYRLHHIFPPMLSPPHKLLVSSPWWWRMCILGFHGCSVSRSLSPCYDGTFPLHSPTPCSPGATSIGTWCWPHRPNYTSYVPSVGVPPPREAACACPKQRVHNHSYLHILGHSCH